MKFKEYFSKLLKRGKIFVYITAVVIFIGLVVRLVYYPIVNRFEELDQEILLKEKQLRINWRNLAARETVLKAYSAYDGYALAAGSDEADLPKEQRASLSFAAVLGLAWDPDGAKIDLTPQEFRTKKAPENNGKAVRF